jgi:DNA polymerase (family X)
MDLKQIVKELDTIATVLELKDENFFKIRAYHNASRVLEASGLLLNPDTKIEDIEKIKGIGSHIASKIKEMLDKGSSAEFEMIKSSIPPGLLEMLKIPKLGPKKIKYLYDNLEISTIGELEYACIENRLIELPGFGKKTQENILKGIALLKKYKEQYLYSDIIIHAEKILRKIIESKKASHASLAGSIRRKKEIIKDIDIVASAKDIAGLIDFFTEIGEASDVISKGENRASIRLDIGIEVDIIVVEEEVYAHALQHFTGSKEHNTALRTHAKKNHVKVNEYGLFLEDKAKGTERLLTRKSENDIYAYFKMDYIEPELRENFGEIEAALEHRLPRLIENKDLNGIFHIHSEFSDGSITLEQVCTELIKEGFTYGGISEHSKSAYYANGLKEEDLDRYFESIDALNKKYAPFHLFKGIESDILIDGSLDYQDEVLKRFDFVIASVHSSFNMEEEQMTNRVVKALENKYTTILGHPTGRLLLARQEYKIDMQKIINAASVNEKAIEINASPHRLDLDWRLCKYAKEKNVKIFINPDAHNTENIKDYRFGINIARKGWLQKEDVANTLNLKEMIRYLRKGKEDA